MFIIFNNTRIKNRIRCDNMWISVDDVKEFNIGLKPKHFNLEAEDTTGLDTILTKWILQSQSLINTYTNQHYTDTTITPAVQNVCLRLTSNMVSLALQKRDNPLIRVNDWTITGLSSDVFTDDLKEDLRPFVKDSSNTRDMIGVYAITGDD